MRPVPNLAGAGLMTPGAWNPVAKILNDNFAELKILDAPGYRVKRSGGQALDIKFPVPPPVVMPSHPFLCTLVPQFHEDGTPDGNKVRVEYYSTLYNYFGCMGYQVPITGLYDPSDPFPVLLDLDDLVPTWDDSAFGASDVVILEVEFDSAGAIVTAGIETRGNGSSVDPTKFAYDGTDALFEMDTTVTYQKYARIVLAVFEDGALNQKVTNDLTLISGVVSGISSQILTPVSL